MKIKIMFVAIASLMFLGCTPKVSKSTTTAYTSVPVSKPAPTPAPAKDPNAELLNSAKTRFPDLTSEKLNQGRSIYYGNACTGCHAAKNIPDWDEMQWTGILDDMAKRADLKIEEKDAVWKFIVAVKLTAK